MADLHDQDEMPFEEPIVELNAPDGTVYRYDRTNGVTEYRIEPITVELIETQP